MQSRTTVGLFIFLSWLPMVLTAQKVGEKTPAPPPLNATEAASPKTVVLEPAGGKVEIPDVVRDAVIAFTLYTVEDRTLKLSAQLYPLLEHEERKVSLEVKEEDGWKNLGEAAVNPVGWLATFRIENWEAAKDAPYRVTHVGGAIHEGRIRRDPTEKEEIVVAAFSGNSTRNRDLRTDIIRNLETLDPDLLFFSGDQSGDPKDHLAGWLLFGRQFGELMRDRPTVTLPDDRDVGQENLWGEKGKIALSRNASDGGYRLPAKYVNQVQRAQTGHLPDPYDPTPVGQDITVYYTSLTLGGIGFAILEDRKWKTGPGGLVPGRNAHPDRITDPGFEPSTVDVPEARLLGQRQLEFLREWGQDWQNTEMKAVLSQTIFAGSAHIYGKHNSRLIADLDTNGWPQAGRARALREIRRFFGFHLAGNQNLATVIHHGIEDWEDAGISFSIPSIVNDDARWWWPLEPTGPGRPDSGLPFAGRTRDGFDNKITMKAYANPTRTNHQAAGFGVVRFNKKKRTITMECWPRFADIEKPDEQFPGWPVTIDQEANYARAARAYLPELFFTGVNNPIVQIIDEDLEEVVHTLRINGNRWRPKVFKEGTYTIRASNLTNEKILEGVASLPDDQKSELKIAF
ncbi:MAG: hypothetical protein AAF514_15635 [Verrucomicrobiota bacterium]